MQIEHEMARSVCQFKIAWPQDTVDHSGKDAVHRPQAIVACLVGILGLYRTINNGFCARKIL